MKHNNLTHLLYKTLKNIKTTELKELETISTDIINKIILEIESAQV